MTTTQTMDYIKIYEEMFEKSKNDKNFYNQLKTDPLATIQSIGINGFDNLSEETKQTMEKLIKNVLSVHENFVDGVYKISNDNVNKDYVTFSTNAFGLVWKLSEEATQDAISGSMDLVGAMLALAAAAVAAALIAVIAAILAAFLAVSAVAIALTDAAYHKGIYITVPWTDFIPFFGTGMLVVLGPVTK